VTTVVVHGASGLTGRAVVEQLVRVGVDVMPCGRSRVAGEVAGTREWRVVDATDPRSVRTALSGAAAIVQCAPLPLEHAVAFAGAAVEAGVAFVDVCADARIVAATHAAHAEAATRRGVPICVGVAPIGGALGEWLGIVAATEAARDGDVRELIVAHASNGIPPSAGSLQSGLRMFADSPLSGHRRVVDFPPPFGRQFAFRFPLGSGRLSAWFPRARVEAYAALCIDGIDSALMATLVSCARAWLDRSRAAESILDDVTERIAGTHARDRSDPSSLSFTVAVQAVADSQAASVAVVGSAPYRVTAAMVALVTEALLQRRDLAGPVGAAQVLDPEAALDALRRGCGLRMFVG
jgi:hypothetical protein